MIYQSVHIIDYPLMDVSKDNLRLRLLRDIKENFPIVTSITDYKEVKHIFNMRIIYAADGVSETKYEYKYEVIIDNEDLEQIKQQEPHLFL